MSCTSLTHDTHQAIVNFTDAGRKFALAVILKDTGHTPRKAGTKALIDSSGAITGTIGGGAVEAEAQRRAVEAIRSGRPLVFDFALEGSNAGGAEPVCGGSMRILIDPTATRHAAAYRQAAEAGRQRRSGVLLMFVRHGREMTVDVKWFPADALPQGDAFPGGEAIRSALANTIAQDTITQDSDLRGGSPDPPRQDAARLRPHTATCAAAQESRRAPSQDQRCRISGAAHLFVQDDSRLEVLVEPLVPPPLLVIAGGGHIGQALAVQAGLVGFQVLVIDDRPEFTDAALYPEGVTTRCGDIARELADFPVAGDTYVVIVTRGHQQDQRALAACIHRPAAYVGMIGSRRKVAILRKDMLESGAATEEELGRAYAPIGLDIGAETVPEIAASIVAQLIAVRRKGRAPRMPTR